MADRTPEDRDSSKPAFPPILGYVLGFLAILAILAYVAAALLRSL